MNWKNWPYWKKGGGIAGIVIIAMILILLISYPFAKNLDLFHGGQILASTSFVVAMITGGILLAPLYLLNALFFFGELKSLPIAILLFLPSLFPYLGAGMILGHFYGKIKNRNKIPSSTL